MAHEWTSKICQTWTLGNYSQGDREIIGRCELLPWTIDGQYEVEVTYTITQEYWGQGLRTEAARAILQYGFEKMNLSRLISLIDSENVVSQKSPKRSA